MDKYNENKRCPKCASGLVETRYIDCGAARELIFVKYYHGKIMRTCTRCGHMWAEEALDYKEKDNGEE